MLIVDAQIHLWNAGNPTSATHRQVPAYLKDDALSGILCRHTPAVNRPGRRRRRQHYGHLGPAGRSLHKWRLRLVATIHDPAVMREMLAHLGLCHSGQRPRPRPTGAQRRRARSRRVEAREQPSCLRSRPRRRNSPSGLIRLVRLDAGPVHLDA